MRSPLSPVLAGLLLATAACADHSPLAPSRDATVRKTQLEPTGPWAKIVEGKTGPGSLYALYVPHNWNGEAVYYAHGIRPPSAPIMLNDQDGLFAVRDQLGELGFAVAYSSFSENGWAMKDGAQRTHQLRGLLASQLRGQPERSYLIGHSLGGAIAINLAERFPNQYDGVLAMCGMVGGSTLQVQYIGHVRALFDHFYPGLLPGNVTEVPEGAALTPALQAQVIAAITANPLPLFTIASTAQTPLPYAPIGSLADPGSPAFQTLVQSLLTALGAQLLQANDLLERTHGQSAFDNSSTTYSLGTIVTPNPAVNPGIIFLIGAANAGVQRYSITPAAANYVEKYYVPTGDLQMPVLTVHNLWDPLVPLFHETHFAQLVSAAGASSMLLQRTVPTYGHCNIPPALVVGSFQSLVNWVRSGVKPAA